MALLQQRLWQCCGGIGIRVAQLGFAAQATYWSAVDMHRAIMPNICSALHKPIHAKTDLLTAGVAVDDHVTVQFESEARKAYEKSPWALDRGAAEVIRPALVQAADQVPFEERSP